MVRIETTETGTELVVRSPHKSKLIPLKIDVDFPEHSHLYFGGKNSHVSAGEIILRKKN